MQVAGKGVTRRKSGGSPRSKDERSAAASPRLLDYEDVVIVDKNGVIVFDDLANLSLYDLRPDEVIGKKVTSLYKNLTDENSIFMKVLRDGIPVIDEKQDLLTKENNRIHQISSTYPIMDRGRIIGAVEFSRFLYKTDSLHLIKKHSSHKILRKNNTIYTIDDIVTNTPTMEQIKKKIVRIARTCSTVLLLGKTGTGKELVAQSIHNLSDRCDKPFISQNCAAIPIPLLEGILFGTTKGSFTGAEDRKGLFELAEGGTLFLDELNSMDTSKLVKILKAIEDKCVRRFGVVCNIQLVSRIIAAINKDPQEAIMAGELREDLYYRLTAAVIKLPTLAERRDDIKMLIDHYINLYNDKMEMKIRRVDEAAMERLTSYDWPGNVRELRNVVESFYNDYDFNGVITLEKVAGKLAGCAGAGTVRVGAERGASLRESLEKFERALIRTELERANGVAAKAARNLGISKQLLKYKIEKYRDW